MSNIKNHYLGKEFQAEVVAWQKLRAEAIKKGEEIPVVFDSIAKGIMEIVKGIASKNNYNGYSYLNEMKSDGMFFALKNLKNFDENAKFKNGQAATAFNYMSMAVDHAFKARIKIEKKQQQIKVKSLIEHSIDDLLDEAVHLNTGEDQPTEFLQTIYNDHMSRYLEYEQKIKDDKTKNIKKRVIVKPIKNSVF